LTITLQTNVFFNKIAFIKSICHCNCSIAHSNRGHVKINQSNLIDVLLIYTLTPAVWYHVLRKGNVLFLSSIFTDHDARILAT